jgi:hypothetical protein
MRLIDLNPRWVGAGGPGVTRNGQPVERRDGIAIMFHCPCGCGDGVYVYVDPPLDGKGPYEPQHVHWERFGDTFETLTLRPSIQRLGGCGWHGFITNGEVTTV